MNKFAKIKSQSKFLCLILISFFISCSKDLEQITPEDRLPCGVPVLLSADSIFEYAYYCDASTSQTLVIYTPQNWEEEEEHPCIIFYHGAITDANQYWRNCKYFAERGIIAISVNHRFTFSNTYNKEGLRDGHSAIRWIKDNRLSLGVDTSRIAVYGSSAGGSVALSCYILQDYNHSTDDLSISINPDVFIVANPHLINFLDLPQNTTDHPPTIFFQGDDDDLTRLSKLESYRSTALSRGASEIEIIVYPGRGHGFYNYSVSVSDYEDTILRADSFLVDHGYLLNYSDNSLM